MEYIIIGLVILVIISCLLLSRYLDKNIDEKVYPMFIIDKNDANKEWYEQYGIVVEMGENTNLEISRQLSCINKVIVDLTDTADYRFYMEDALAAGISIVSGNQHIKDDDHKRYQKLVKKYYCSYIYIKDLKQKDKKTIFDILKESNLQKYVRIEK